MTKKNPWAICTASVGRKDKNKYERCVRGVKKESGMKENILKAAFQKHLSEPLKKTMTNFKKGFEQGYYELTPSGKERFKQKMKKKRQAKPRGPVSTMTKMGPRGKINPATGTMNQSTEIVRDARQALAEACWKGYKAKGMKKKGNRMVPNCVKEATLDDLPTKMKLAARRARDKGEDPVDAAERVRKEAEARADQEHYGDRDIQENDTLADLKAQGRANRKAGEAAAKADKPKHTRRDSLELKGTVTPNHPDYLKKKLYDRPTKGSTMPGDDLGDATKKEPIKSINKRGMTNKSTARQRRWSRKQDRITKAADRAGSYADAEYKDILKGGDSDFN